MMLVKKVLKNSNITEFTDKYFNEILKRIKDRIPSNAYQAQQMTIDEVRLFKEDKECKDSLEKRAFDSGSDIDTILFVAAINIRDKIIEKLEFKSEDIDKHDPANSVKK